MLAQRYGVFSSNSLIVDWLINFPHFSQLLIKGLQLTSENIPSKSGEQRCSKKQNNGGYIDRAFKLILAGGDFPYGVQISLLHDGGNMLLATTNRRAKDIENSCGRYSVTEILVILASAHASVARWPSWSAPSPRGHYDPHHSDDRLISCGSALSVLAWSV